MIEISVQDGELILDLKGIDQLWALKMELDIPLENIESVEAIAPQLNNWNKGIRFPGTHLPGFIVAGTFYQDGKRLFWNVKRKDDAAVILRLKDERYDELIIGVEDADATISFIQQALSEHQKDTE